MLVCYVAAAASAGVVAAADDDYNDDVEAGNFRNYFAKCGCY